MQGTLRVGPRRVAHLAGEADAKAEDDAADDEHGRGHGAGDEAGADEEAAAARQHRQLAAKAVAGPGADLGGGGQTGGICVRHMRASGSRLCAGRGPSAAAAPLLVAQSAARRSRPREARRACRPVCAAGGGGAHHGRGGGGEEEGRGEQLEHVVVIPGRGGAFWRVCGEGASSREGGRVGRLSSNRAGARRGRQAAEHDPRRWEGSLAEGVAVVAAVGHVREKDGAEVRVRNHAAGAGGGGAATVVKGGGCRSWPGAEGCDSAVTGQGRAGAAARGGAGCAASTGPRRASDQQAGMRGSLFQPCAPYRAGVGSRAALTFHCRSLRSSRGCGGVGGCGFSCLASHSIGATRRGRAPHRGQPAPPGAGALRACPKLGLRRGGDGGAASGAAGGRRGEQNARMRASARASQLAQARTEQQAAGRGDDGDKDDGRRGAAFIEADALLVKRGAGGGRRGRHGCGCGCGCSRISWERCVSAGGGRGGEERAGRRSGACNGRLRARWRLCGPPRCKAPRNSLCQDAVTRLV